MAIREKRAVIAEPSTTTGRLLMGGATTGGMTQPDRRPTVILHPRPGRYFLEPSLTARWGCAPKL